jgi:hypothetical protein
MKGPILIKEFKMKIDAPDDYELFRPEKYCYVGPQSQEFLLHILQSDDPPGGNEDLSEIAIRHSGGGEITHLNENALEIDLTDASFDYHWTFLRNPSSKEVFLLMPINKAGIEKTKLRSLCRQIVSVTTFVTPEIEGWIDLLVNGRFAAAESYNRSYGSGDGYITSEEFQFFSDASYRWTRQTRVSVTSYEGLSFGGKTSRSQDEGLWDVMKKEGELCLILKSLDRESKALPLGRDGGYFLFGEKKYFKRS